MKYLFFFLFSLVLGISCKKDCEDPPDPQPECKPDLAKGLLAYYPFNGNFNDESGNGNHAVSKNGASLTSDFIGRTDRSAGFDGINDYLIVAGNSKLNADTITISFQVMVNTMNRRHATVSRINFETAESFIFGIHHSQPFDNKWNYSVTPGIDIDACTTTTENDTALALYSNPPIQPGRWYNVTATFKGGVQSIYIDGVLHGTKTQTFNSAKKCDNADFMIGGWWKNDIVSIDGKIDEVRLYNRLLTDCEIAKLAESFKED